MTSAIANTAGKPLSAVRSLYHTPPVLSPHDAGNERCLTVCDNNKQIEHIIEAGCTEWTDLCPVGVYHDPFFPLIHLRKWKYIAGNNNDDHRIHCQQQQQQQTISAHITSGSISFSIISHLSLCDNYSWHYNGPLVSCYVGHII